MGKKQNQKKQTPKKKGKYDISLKVKGAPDELLKVLLNTPPKKNSPNS